MEVFDGKEPSALAQILAQTRAQSSNHTCKTTANRNKEALDDFYNLLNGSSVYSDDDFTPDESSFYWTDMQENRGHLT